jgi:hypothetical protein
MSAIEIGKQLVAFCQEGKGLEAVDALYDEKIVSIEAQGSDALPARMEGIEAVRGKNSWWYDNHEVHASLAVGPFCGQRENQFAVLFEMDVTFKPSSERSKLVEVALYTIAESGSSEKVIQEEFWYLTD